jgi:hypothetical protein
MSTTSNLEVPMCPVCLSSVALVLGGATSAAALATLRGLRLRAVREKRGITEFNIEEIWS